LWKIAQVVLLALLADARLHLASLQQMEMNLRLRKLRRLLGE
jgi:hypothetical protein